MTSFYGVERRYQRKELFTQRTGIITKDKKFVAKVGTSDRRRWLLTILARLFRTATLIIYSIFSSKISLQLLAKSH